MATRGLAGNYAFIEDNLAGNEYLGFGFDVYSVGAEATITVTSGSQNSITCNINNAQGQWAFGLSSTDGAPLKAGTYKGADFSLYLNSTSEPVYKADYTINEIVYGADGKITALDIIISAYAFNGATEPPLQAQILFNASRAVPPKNRILSTLTANATEGQPFAYFTWASGSLTVYDKETPQSAHESRFDATGLPAGLAIDHATGRISGVPQAQGNYSVEITATDADGVAAAVLDIAVDPPFRSTGPYTALIVRADANQFNWISQGKSRVFTPADGDFSGYGNYDNGFGFTFSAFTDLPYEYWNGEFAAPYNAPLSGGDYPVATRFPFQQPEEAGLDIDGDGHGCNISYGSFVVNEVSGGSWPTHFSASFFQRCEYEDNPPLWGHIWYQALNAITSNPYSTAIQGRQYRYQLVANNDPKTFAATGLPAGLSIDRSTGIIAGTPVGIGVFEISVSAQGPSTTAHDTLELRIIRAKQLADISTRATLGGFETGLIGGFILYDFTLQNTPKKLLIRARGPSLVANGVSSALQNPTLTLYNQSGPVAFNNDWRTTEVGNLIRGPQQTEIEQSGLAPSDEREPAMIVNLPLGVYTAAVQAADANSGTALVEIYDVSADSPTRLINISTRGMVGLNDDVLIGGFIVVGGNGSGGRMLLRAIGPSLLWSVRSPLPDPVMEVYDTNGTRISMNDNWADVQRVDILATGIAPTNSKEAAVLVDLPPGAYTAIVRGKNSSFGTGLVEIYNLF
jgi:hypothetical protein